MENNLTTLSASITDRGLSEKRAQNEDSYIDFGEHGIFAVADGVGGAQAGDVASQMAVEIIGEAFVNRTPNFDAEDTMRRAIEQANSAIYQMSSELPSLSSMATTVVALYINGDVATIGHVGDSRVYRVDRGGTLEQVTADHSVVEEEVRAGRLTPEQALNHPSRNIISRALGAESTVDVDLKTIMVGEGSTFLLCSDGITKHVSDAEIAVLLGSGADLEMICGRLKELCYARGAEDNLTAVTVRVAEKQTEPYDVVVDDEGSSPVLAAEEEETIATARSPFDSMASEDVLETSSQPSDALHAAADDADEQAYLMQEPPAVEAPADISGYTSSSVVVPAAEPDAAKYRSHSTAPLAEPATAISSSSVLTSLVMLLLGGILGAAAMYFLWPSAVPETQVEAPAITEMKSTNTPLTAFEEGRRIVDADPERYITANAASLQDAEDYFLMGRAFLLTGKQWEAKRAFTEAKNRLAQADPANAKTLAAEIAMALAIIESPSASESFKKELGGGSATPANTAPRANTAPTNAANAISAAPSANRTAVTRPATPRPLATSGDSRPRQVAGNGSAAARPIR
jgi:protein phosphatase